MPRLLVIFAIAMTLSLHAACDHGAASDDLTATSIGSTHSGKSDTIGVQTPGAFDYFNDPARFGMDFERRYDALPSEGAADQVPWTDTYWPKREGGIAVRWLDEAAGRHYTSPAREELDAMSPEAIAQLSPTEKYDILVGNYNYTLTRRVLAQNRPDESAWQGYCHGWTPASMHFEEPNPVTMVNADGVEVRFGSSDVKALLTYFQGEVVRSLYGASQLPFLAETVVVGSVCRSGSPTDPSCYDTNPGAFHVIMTNLLGLQGQAFGIDATNTYEKWNQPVHHYTVRELGRRAPSEGAGPDAVEEVVIEATVTYTMEIEPTWNAVTGTEFHHDKTVRYSYTLELDAAGEIVGGQWLLLLEGGQDLTLHAAWRYLSESDENGDGTPDLSTDQIRSVIWEHFTYPDFVWFQPRGEFSPEFRQATSANELLVNNVGTRKKLYAYMARLADLYAASVE